MIPTLAERSRQRQRRALAQRLPPAALSIPSDPPLGLKAYLTPPKSPLNAPSVIETHLSAGAEITAARPRPDEASPAEPGRSDLIQTGGHEPEPLIAPVDGMAEPIRIEDGPPLAKPPGEPAMALVGAEGCPAAPGGLEPPRPQPCEPEAMHREPVVPIAAEASRPAALELVLWLLLLLLDGGLALLELRRRSGAGRPGSTRPVSRIPAATDGQQLLVAAGIGATA
ncbi:MAG: hypothetical protein RLZZ124_324 [Cyanobacteriota bacterium]